MQDGFGYVEAMKGILEAFMATIQKTIIEQLPAGLERALLRILSFHVGEGSAIGRDELVTLLRNAHGYKFSDDRPVRALINELRKRGEMICSRGGIGGGYWMAASQQEMDEYIERELHPRAMDLLEQERALRAASIRAFGGQVGLGL